MLKTTTTKSKPLEMRSAARCHAPLKQWRFLSTEGIAEESLESLLREHERDSSVLFNVDSTIDTTESHQLMAFNGRNSFVMSPLVTAKVTGVTLAAWFRTNDFTKRGQLIVYNGSDAQGNGYGVAVNNENDTSGIIRILYGGVRWFDTHTYINDQNWHHVVLVIREDTGVELYLDAVSRFETRAESPRPPTMCTEIGRNNYPAARYFAGSIDRVAIWTSALSQTEVQALWKAQVQLYCAILPALQFVPIATALEVYVDEEAADCVFGDAWTPSLVDLVSYWPLETSYNDLKGTNHGRPFQVSRVGAWSTVEAPLFATAFDGKNSFIQTQLVCSKRAGITMSAWFQSDDFSKAGQTIFYNGSDRSQNGYGVTLNNEGDHGGILRVLYGGLLWFETNTYILDDKFHHVMLVIRPDGRPDLYLDSKLVFVGHAGRYPNAPTAYTEIGRNDFPTHRYFKGVIKQVAFWKTDLSSDDVRLVYSRQRRLLHMQGAMDVVYRPLQEHPALLRMERIRLLEIRESRCRGHALVRHALICSICGCSAAVGPGLSSFYVCCNSCDYRECESCHRIAGDVRADDHAGKTRTPSSNPFHDHAGKTRTPSSNPFDDDYM